MIKSIMKDEDFLAQKSENATKEDIQVVNDLVDTLNANLDRCVGMAANMIGVKKRIIVICDGDDIVVMINPIITRKQQIYDAEESCLSLTGVRKIKRYNRIKVKYLDKKFNKKEGVFTGFTAQIIQHEVDHCNGIII
ncbi:MAG: peptide deformylase [Clostridium sp.]|jgi:peptide deformylase|nr:peptide deformylase [Clostridium sp.]